MSMALRLGDRVQVRARAGVVYGRVEAVSTTAALPDLAAAAPSMRPELEGQHEEARAILEEWGVSRVAMISYAPAPGRPDRLIFAALEVDGQWFDMQHQPLTIAFVGR